MKSSKSKVKSNSKKTGFAARFKRMSRASKILLVLVALLAATLAGTYGYSEWKEQDLKAKAGRYGTIYEGKGVKIVACKFPVWGGATGLRVIASKPSWSSGRALGVYPKTYNPRGSGSGFTHTHSGIRRVSSWWGGVVTIAETTVPSRGGFYATVHQGGFDPLTDNNRNILIAFVPYC